MAEQYLTRRERREAERRAAEAAVAAQHSAEGPGKDGPKEPSAPAKLTVKPQTPATAHAAPASRASDSAPARPAVQEPDVQQTQEAPRVQHEPDPRPTEKMQPIGTVPAPAPAKPKAPAQAPSKPGAGPTQSDVPNAPEAPTADSADKSEFPQFQTRAERRRYMREHGLEPAPVDADEAPQTTSPASAKPVEPQRPEADADKSPAPVVKKAPVNPAAAAPKSPESEDAEAQPEKAEAQTEKLDDAPMPQETPKAQETAKSEDWVARRQAASKPRERRSPVVKPNTQGIKVVSAPSGAPAVTETKDGQDSADTSLGSAENSKSAPAADQQPTVDFRQAASGPATMPIESVAISPEESQMLQADEGEEVENPPAGPMKARDITYGDGEILVGDRPSALPYIVLGVGGLVAIILIVIALIMLF